MTPQQRKNRTLIVGIFAMSIVPLLIAGILAKNPSLLERNPTNRGQLIQPVITTERNDFQGFDSFTTDNLGELSSHWLIVNVIPQKICESLCLEAIYKSRQLRLMLNKELVRTRRVVILMDNSTDMSVAAQWWRDDVDLLRIKPSLVLKEKLNTLHNGTFPEGALLLIDPLGNVMMQYAPDFNTYDVKSDLMQLLKISQIG